MSDPILAGEGLSKRYGPVTALDDVDFAVFPGEIVALVGDNGAGKSTLVKTLAGAVIPDNGTIHFRGERVSIHNPHDSRARHRDRLPGPGARAGPRHDRKHVPRTRAGLRRAAPAALVPEAPRDGEV